MLLAVSACALSAGGSWAQAQLPPGFYSFAPGKQETDTNALSAAAQRDMDAALAAYVAKDYAASLPFLELPSAEGNIQANWLTAHILRKGLGVPVDQAGAFARYDRIASDYIGRRSEVFGNDRYFALDSLTVMARNLRTGNKAGGVGKDLAKALHYYLTAASAGHAGAQYGLGMMYFNGEGVSRDRSYGMRWLGTAAKKRYPPAAAMLGDAYKARGDKVRAVVWYRIAADNADTKLSAYVLGQHEQLLAQLNEKKTSRVKRLYTKWNRQYPVRRQQALSDQ
jgi:TPR repeat protein